MSLINQMLRDLEARHSNAAQPHDASHGNIPPQSPRPNTSTAKRIGAVLMGIALLGGGMGAGWYLAQNDTPAEPIQPELAATQRIQISGEPSTEETNAAQKTTRDAQHFTPQAGPKAHETAASGPPPETEPLDETAVGAQQVTSQGQEIKTQPQPSQTPQPATPATPAVHEAQTQTAALASAPEDHQGTISFTPATDPLEQRKRVLRQAQQLYNQGDYPAAIATLHSHLQQEAGGSTSTSAQIIALDARIYRQLALAQLRVQRRAEAITTLEQGHIRAPEDVALHILYARVLMEEEQHQRAYTMLRDLPQPHLAAQPDFYALRAALARQLGAYAEAIDLYTLLCNLQPQRGDWRLGLAISQHQHGDLGQARANYQRVAANTRLGAQLRNFAAHQAGQIQIQ